MPHVARADCRNHPKEATVAVWTRRETVIRRIETVLPVPAVGADLCQAYAAAESRYRARHKLAPDTVLPDDALTIRVTDDEVLISFEVAE